MGELYSGLHLDLLSLNKLPLYGVSFIFHRLIFVERIV